MVENERVVAEVEPLVGRGLVVDGEVSLGALAGVRVSRGDNTALAGVEERVSGIVYSHVSVGPVGGVRVD